MPTTLPLLARPPPLIDRLTIDSRGGFSHFSAQSVTAMNMRGARSTFTQLITHAAHHSGV
jgi:hypothetical protein